MILDTAVAVGRAGERRADVPIAQPARRIRVDLVAPGHARDLPPREQDDVEDRGGQPDQPFDPPLECELARCAIRHGAAIVDSPAC